MTDDRITVAMGVLRESVRPDADFVEDLFERLIGEVDFERGTVRTPGRLERLRAALRIDSERLIWLTAVAALLAALTVTGLFVGSRLGTRDLVTRSRTLYASLPSFDITIPIVDYLNDERANGAAADHLTIRYRWDGVRLLRGDILASDDDVRPPGSWFIFDGHTYYEFAPNGDLAVPASAIAVEEGFKSDALFLDPVGASAKRSSPLQPFPLTWERPQYFQDPQPDVPCDSPTALGREVVAGRTAEHVVCGGDRQAEYWLDVETGFILRVRDVDRDMQATSVQVRPPFDAAVFAIPRGPHGELPLNYAHIERGSYFTPLFRPTIAFDLGEGWFNGFDRPTDGGLEQNAFAIAFARGERPIDPATGKPFSVDGGAAELAAWLASHPALAIGSQSVISVGGVSGVAFDARATAGPGSAPCEGFPDYTCISLFDLGEVGAFRADTTQYNRFYVLDVRGELVFVSVWARSEVGRDLGVAAFEKAVSFP